MDTGSSRATKTRTALVRAARTLFAQKGFHESGTHEIVEIAGVTRGALQHYFPRKEDLFLAVYLQVEQDIMDAALAAIPVGPQGISWGQLKGGLNLYLEAATTAEVQRILLNDGPVVLGWTQWRATQMQHGLGYLETAIMEGVRSGQIRPQPPRPLALLISSTINEAAIIIANAETPSAAKADVQFALNTLLASLTDGVPAETPD